MKNTRIFLSILFNSVHLNEGRLSGKQIPWWFTGMQRTRIYIVCCHLWAVHIAASSN